MKAREILQAEGLGCLFAVLEDGSCRWLSDTVSLMDSGPAAAWVERMRRVKSARGGARIVRPLAHDVLLATLNARLGGGP